jgi:hypothetical protein
VPDKGSGGIGPTGEQLRASRVTTGDWQCATLQRLDSGPSCWKQKMLIPEREKEVSKKRTDSASRAT